MLFRKNRRRRRLGVTTIETAAVVIPVVMFLFGVFEYGRLLMDWNILNNAAREGCRYALVNNTSSTISTDVTTVVNSYMGREVNSFSGGAVTVVVSGVHSGTNYTGNNVNNLVAGDLITVKVSGTYLFLNIFPFHVMPTFNMNSASTMVCEGAM
jgi:Flp pilus assembly protein TadG